MGPEWIGLLGLLTCVTVGGTYSAIYYQILKRRGK